MSKTEEKNKQSFIFHLPDLVHYACIAKGTTILVEFSSKEQPEIESLALKCLENTPPRHTKLSHTVRKRSYTFLIDDPIVYFAIFNETLDNSESNLILDQAKFNFEQLLASGSILSFDKVTSNCFQSHVNEVFRELFPTDSELEASVNSMSKHSRNSSLESSGGKKGSGPLLGKKIKAALKKKKRLFDGINNNACSRDVSSVENKVDVYDLNGTCKDIYVPMHKNGGDYPGDRQKAKQVWKKHVWVVLSLDVLVCVILFGVWLWICRGFECIDG